MSSPADMTIGWDVVSPGNTSVKGKISDVRIWSTARSASEIANSKDTVIAANSTGLLANYLFDDSSSATNRVTNATKLNGGKWRL